MDLLSGSFAVEYFRNGNPLALSCGSMASVCSPKSVSGSGLTTIRVLSRLREEHPLVSPRSTLCSSETDLRCRVALQSFKTSKRYAKRDQGLLLTSISTSGTSISKIVETSSRLFLSNFPPSLVPVVTSFIAFTWSMTTVLKSPQKLH